MPRHHKLGVLDLPVHFCSLLNFECFYLNGGLCTMFTNMSVQFWFFFPPDTTSMYKTKLSILKFPFAKFRLLFAVLKWWQFRFSAFTIFKNQIHQQRWQMQKGKSQVIRILVVVKPYKNYETEAAKWESIINCIFRPLKKEICDVCFLYKRGC